jgi:hypothetical protein
MTEQYVWRSRDEARGMTPEGEAEAAIAAYIAENGVHRLPPVADPTAHGIEKWAGRCRAAGGARRKCVAAFTSENLFTKPPSTGSARGEE